MCGETEPIQALSDHEGRAVISVLDGIRCLDDQVVDSRIYYTKPFNQVTAVFSPKIMLIPIGTADLLGRGESRGGGNKGD